MTRVLVGLGVAVVTWLVYVYLHIKYRR